jgi:outer membrane murein-binding lipoprotein Lpp
MQRTKLALLLAAVLLSPYSYADDAELRARIDKLEAEVQALAAQLKQVNSKTEAIANQQEAAASVPPAPPPGASASGTSTPVLAPAEVAGSALGKTTIYGYGEINYNHYSSDSTQTTQADLRRAVFGFGHRFDDDTRFLSEFEYEHAVTSRDDAGEAEVEQFYIDHRLGQSTNLKVGLFLIPAGLLNESHEPTTYYGVERNFVETAIIPTTWREGGVGIYGSTDFGLAWDAGVTTGFNLAKWDPSATSECRQSPLGCVHQELQLANASDLAVYGALNWRGTPGLVVGGSLFTGGAGQDGVVGQSAPDAAPEPVNGARVTLWDVHARWTPDRWDLSALYTHGSISGTAAYNEANAYAPTPIPSAFYGWYTQAAYRLWESGKRSLWPFARYERYNTASAYDGLSPTQSLSNTAAGTETVTTVGFNYQLNPNVVFKADYQTFQVDSSNDRFDLGLGLTF